MDNRGDHMAFKASLEHGCAAQCCPKSCCLSFILALPCLSLSLLVLDGFSRRQDRLIDRERALKRKYRREAEERADALQRLLRAAQADNADPPLLFPSRGNSLRHRAQSAGLPSDASMGVLLEEQELLGAQSMLEEEALRTSMEAASAAVRDSPSPDLDDTGGARSSAVAVAVSAAVTAASAASAGAAAAGASMASHGGEAAAAANGHGSRAALDTTLSSDAGYQTMRPRSYVGPEDSVVPLAPPGSPGRSTHVRSRSAMSTSEWAGARSPSASLRQRPGSSTLSTITVSAAKLQEIDDPILAMLHVLHKLMFVCDQPLTLAANPRRHLLRRFKQALFAPQSAGEAMKSQLKRLAAGAAQAIENVDFGPAAAEVRRQLAEERMEATAGSSTRGRSRWRRGDMEDEEDVLETHALTYRQLRDVLEDELLQLDYYTSHNGAGMGSMIPNWAAASIGPSGPGGPGGPGGAPGTPTVSMSNSTRRLLSGAAAVDV